MPLKPYREDELMNLRGKDVTGQLQEWDRVYDYAYYNDLADPDSNSSLARPVLGGSALYPYPRRGKTGRQPSKTDPKTESRLPATMSLDIYVPRDERFGHLKMADFLTYAIKALAQAVLPVLKAICDETPNEFDSMEDVLKLYEGGLPVVNKPLIDELRERIPFEMIKELFRAEGNQRFLKFPLPQVIQGQYHVIYRLDFWFLIMIDHLVLCRGQVCLENRRRVYSGNVGRSGSGDRQTARGVPTCEQA